MSVTTLSSPRWLIIRILLIGFILSALPASAKALRVALSDSAPPMSYTVNGKPVGMVTELLDALFSSLPLQRPQYHAFPWARAQHLVEVGEMDLFVTFPSNSRKQYASFTADALYTLDYGYLIYDIKGRHADQIASAEKFRHLQNLVVVSQHNSAWEAENIPGYMRRYMVNGPASLMHMTFARKAGDFFIMYPKQAAFYAKQLGYENHLGIKKAEFIPHSLVEMHIGLRKSHPEHDKLHATIDAAMKDPAFIATKRAIELKYKRLFPAPPAPDGSARTGR